MFLIYLVSTVLFSWECCFFNPFRANDELSRHEGSEIRGSLLSLITIDSFKMKKNRPSVFERELNFLSNGVLDFKFGQSGSQISAFEVGILCKTFPLKM